MQREVLELLAAASAELLTALGSDEHQLGQASARLDDALGRARRLARLDEIHST